MKKHKRLRSDLIKLLEIFSFITLVNLHEENKIVKKFFTSFQVCFWEDLQQNKFINFFLPGHAFIQNTFEKKENC